MGSDISVTVIISAAISTAVVLSPVAARPAGGGLSQMFGEWVGAFIMFYVIIAAIGWVWSKVTGR